MNKQDRIQEKAMQFQGLQQRLRGLEQKEQMLLQAIDELERAKLALKDLKKSKGDAYIPLGANNFVLGEVKENEKVLIAIGAGIAVKKDREEAIKVSDERLKEFQAESDKVMKEIRKMSNELGKIQTDIETLRK